ncbi:MAG: GNAT family N-acetyltransferase [Bacteroidota bacterium]
MMLSTRTIRVIDDKKDWDAHFDKLPLHLRDINLSFDYYFMYEVNGNGKARLFTVTEGDELYFYPFLLRSIETTVLDGNYFDIESAYGYSGPVSTSSNMEFLNSCSEAFMAYCKENKIVSEFIRLHPLLENYQLLSQNESVKLIPLRDYVYVDLQRAENEIWDSYTSQNRNKIRKAEKNNVEIIHDYNCQYFEEFARIYQKNMEHLNASMLYFFSKEFFTALLALIKKNGLLLIAKDNMRVLGASVFLLGNFNAYYFLSSATEEGKKNAVSNLLLNKGIMHCKKSGMKKVHLGGGMTDSAEDSLLVFKKNFSSKTAPFYIGKRIHFHEQYDLLCADWDRRFAPESVKYKNILQRYRWSKADLL